MITRSGSTMRSRILACAVLGVPLEHEGQRLDDLLDGLVELGLGRVLGLDVGHQRGT